MRRRRHSRVRVEGITLVELLVVLVIVAVTAGAAVMGLNAVTGAKVDSAALEIAAATRYAYGRAISRGSTVRLAFDLDRHTFSIEEAAGRLVLSRVGDARRTDDEGDPEEVVDPWRVAEQRLSETLNPSVGESVFHVVGTEGGTPFDGCVPHRFGETDPFEEEDLETDPDVRIVRFGAAHEPTPRTTGRGYIYYFPNGLSTAGVVQVADTDGETVTSIVFDELMGTAEIKNYAFEPEELTEAAFEEEDSEVRDPG